MELRLFLKASSIVALIVGGIGSWTIFSGIGQLFILGIVSGNGFLNEITWVFVVFVVMLVLFGGPLAFVSALCLVLLRLTDDQRDVLGFLAFMGSVTALIVIPLLWALSALG